MRPWNINDAEDLFESAKNEVIGLNCGWPAHKSIDDSKEVIKNVLSNDNTFAIVIKESNKVIGSIGIILEAKYNDEITTKNEVEIGYWIGEDYWGNGYIPEAAQEIIRYSFQELEASRIWCCNYSHNKNSERVKEKLGFKHYKIIENYKAQLIDMIVDLKVGYIDKITSAPN